MTLSDNGSDRVSIRAEELARLQGEDMLSKLEVKLEQRLHRRFGVLLVGVAVLSFFGIQALADLFISRQLAPEISKARDAANDAFLEGELASRTIKELQDTVKEFRETVTSAKTQAEDALASAEKLSTEAKQSLNELRNEVGVQLDALKRLRQEVDRVGEALLELPVAATEFETRPTVIIQIEKLSQRKSTG